MPTLSQILAGKVGSNQNPLDDSIESSGFEGNFSSLQDSDFQTFQRISGGKEAQTSTYILRIPDGEFQFTFNGCQVYESEQDGLTSIQKILAARIATLGGPSLGESLLTAELNKLRAKLADVEAWHSAEIEKVRADAEARHSAEIERVRAEVEARHSAEIERVRAEAQTKSAELQNLLDAIREADKAREAADQAHEDEKSQLAKELEKAQKELEKLKLKFGAPKPNSDNSSTPGSANIGGSKKKRRTRTTDPNKPKRKRGGQPGHKPNNHKRLEPDEIKVYKPESTTCEDCGCEMNHVEAADSVFQQIDIPVPPPIVTDHVAETYECPNCHNTHKGEIPEEIKRQGSFGANLVALIVHLKILALSFRKIKSHLQKWNNVNISLGALVNIFIKHSEALEDANQEIEKEIKKQEIVNVDETTHRENGRILYTWVFVTMKALLYRISSRGRDMLDRVLGSDYVGFIGSDYYGVYISYASETVGVQLQTCLAHLKRDFQNCFEHIDPDISRYGEKMLAIINSLFMAWHTYQADPSPANHEALRRWGETLEREARIAPDKGKPKSIAKRFEKTPGSYTRFINIPGLEPTNNASERAIRPLVVQRAVTQGTRGERGRLALERVWTVFGTCQARGRSFIDFFKRCMAARAAGQKPPSIFD
jgi:transposase